MPERPVERIIGELRAIQKRVEDNSRVLDTLSAHMAREGGRGGDAAAALRHFGLRRGVNDSDETWARLTRLDSSVVAALRDAELQAAHLRAAADERRSAALARIRAERAAARAVPRQGGGDGDVLLQAFTVLSDDMTRAAKTEAAAVASVTRLARLVVQRTVEVVGDARTAVAVERRAREVVHSKLLAQVAALEEQLRTQRVHAARPHTILELSARLRGDWLAPERNAADIDDAIQRAAERELERRRVAEQEIAATTAAAAAAADASDTAPMSPTISHAAVRTSEQAAAAALARSAAAAAAAAAAEAAANTAVAGVTTTRRLAELAKVSLDEAEAMAGAASWDDKWGCGGGGGAAAELARFALDEATDNAEAAPLAADAARLDAATLREEATRALDSAMAASSEAAASRLPPAAVRLPPAPTAATLLQGGYGGTHYHARRRERTDGGAAGADEPLAALH